MKFDLTDPKTAKAIREALQGEGRVYFRDTPGMNPLRVFDARIRADEVQVKTSEGWESCGHRDEVWSA